MQTARINVNAAVPFDLPEGRAFGGALDGASEDIDAIVAAQKQTSSCGSGHLGEAAGKAGAVFNFNVGAKGVATPNEQENFIPAAGPKASSTATLLRTMVTRDTPFDRFIAGDDGTPTTAPRFPRRRARRYAADADRHLLRGWATLGHDAPAAPSRTRRRT